MMAQVNAGRVRFVGRGEYNNSTQYYVFDLVNYNGNSYYAKVDTIGNLPTDTTYWQLVAEKGNVGPIGLTGNGISSITKTSTSGLVDTYTITFTNGNTTTFDVTNGKGIDRIEKTATVGNIDTYTIYFNDNSTSTFEVANGEVTKEELQEEVDRLSMIYNLFPTTSDEDTEMTLDGTGEVKLKKIGLKGNTYQYSTTGKNLFNYLTPNIKQVAWTPTDSGGFFTSSTFWRNLGNKFELDTTKQYTFSYGARNSTNLYYFIKTYTDNTYETVKTSIVNDGTTLSKTFTPDSEYVAIYFANGANLQNIEIPNIQLEEGNTVTSFERYTGNQPAPSPDYPQDIEVVSGDNTIKVEGKNLCSEAVNGASTVYNIALKVKANLKPNTFYEISFIDNGTNNVYYRNEQLYTTFSSYIITSTGGRQYYSFKTLDTIAPDSSGYYGIFKNNQAQTPQFTEVDIREVEQITTESFEYEPYQSASYPINLPEGIELCKIEDYQDYIRKSTGKNLFNKNSENIILNKYLDANGDLQNATASSVSDYIKVVPNTIYSMQPFRNVSQRLCFYDSGKTFISSVSLAQINPKFTTPNNCQYIRTSFITSDINIYQIEKGNQATSYEPYGKVWYLHKDIGKVVLDGSETYTLTTKTGYSYFLYTMNTGKFPGYARIGGNTVIFDKFKGGINAAGTTNVFNQGNNICCFRYNGGDTLNNFYVTSSIDNVDDFKADLSNNNAIGNYVLATPTTTEITDTTLIEQLDNLENAYSYDTQTNISQTNDDMPFILDVEALMSLKGVLN